MMDCQTLRAECAAKFPLDVTSPSVQQHLGVCLECRKVVDGMALGDRILGQIAQVEPAVPAFDTIAFAAQKAAAGRRKAVALHRKLPFYYTGLAAAAAAVLIVVGVWTLRSHLKRPPLLSEGTELQADEHTVVRAALPSGALLVVSEGAVTRMPSADAEERLALKAGQAAFDVPKLAKGRSLVVRTPDAEVRVHGTRFQVTRRGEETAVQVTEGLVEVRPEGVGRPPVFLASGQSLTVASAMAYQASLRTTVLQTLDRGDFASAEATIAQLLSAGATDQQKAEAKALYAWSLAARGHRALAITAYHQALKLLPPTTQSLWADNACAEVAILLAEEDDAAANAAWLQYLQRFPQGVHANLARQWLSKGR